MISTESLSLITIVIQPQVGSRRGIDMQKAVQIAESNRLPRVAKARVPPAAARNRAGHLTRAKGAATMENRGVVRRGLNLLRSGRELAKTGMIASTTTMLLTGFRLVKPLNPLHPLAGVAFLGFALWHVVQNEKIVRRKRRASVPPAEA